MDLEEVAETIAQYSGRISHVVLTGGEPLLQAKPLAALIARLHGGQKRYHVTLESNGTLYDGDVARQIDLVSLSPKLLPQLLDAEGYPTLQYVHTLQDWLEAKQKHPVGLQLKFVVSKQEDETQILRFLDRLQGCDGHPIFVMPLGRTLSEIRESALAAVSIAIRNNWHYSPRLQVDIWGDRVGV
jgi:radical SAM domain protein